MYPATFTFYEEALFCAAMDMTVIPTCWPNEDGKCGCGRHPNHPQSEVGKAPLSPKGFYGATTDPDTIRSWWMMRPQAGVSINLEMSGLVAVDIDSGQAMEEAIGLGLPPTLIRMSRNGPAYIYRRPDGVACKRICKWGTSEAINILAAGSLVIYGRHRAGADVYLENPGEEPSPAPEWVIDAMLKETSEGSASGVILPQKLPYIDLNALILPNRLKHLIIGLDSKKPSRSEAGFQVATWLVNLGYPDDVIAAILFDKRFGISRRGRRKGLKWVAEEVGRARHKAKPKDPAVGELILKVCAWMEGQQWTGQALTDYLVLLSHLQIVLSTGKIRYGASVRELAELSGFGKNAVSPSNRRLVERGVLMKVRPGKYDGKSTIWTLRRPSINHTSSYPAGTTCYRGSNNNSTSLLPTIYPMCLNVPFQVISHDVWHRNGLGKAALSVWIELHKYQDSSTFELAEKLGYSIRQLGGLLRLLEKHQFARVDSRGYWAAVNVSWNHLNNVANTLSVAGATLHRSSRHEIERQAFQAARRTVRQSQSRVEENRVCSVL